MKQRIFIVDDHPLLRKGLQQLIDGTVDFTVCGEAGNAQDAISSIGRDQPDMAIVDIGLRDCEQGYQLLQAIKQQFPAVSILVLTMYDAIQHVEQAFQLGVNGYITKYEPSERLLEAIRKVSQGQIYLGDEMATSFIKHCVQKPEEKPFLADGKLTQREGEVLQLIGNGLNTREIAHVLFISVKTVESHRANIKRKLKLRNINELIRYAVQVNNTEALAGAAQHLPEAKIGLSANRHSA